MIPPFCFVTDADATLRIPEQAEQAARGGAKWVQLRHKTYPDDDFAALARTLIERLTPLNAQLIINDRVKVAQAIGAHGIHIGQSDGDPGTIRTRIGPDMILGLSIESPSQIAAVPGGVNYLGVGPVRATATKPDHAPPLGWDGLAEITKMTDLPCMAIGGLGPHDVAEIRKAGCVSFAVVSAVSRAAKPEQAARAITNAWNEK